MHRNALPPARAFRPLFSLSIFVALAAAAVALFTSGCTSILPPPAADPTRYYVLTAPAASAQGGTAAGARRVGLRSLDLPDYLRTTKSVVVRRGPNEVRFEEYSRWAEPLNVGIGRALREALLASPRIASVESTPLRSDQRRDCDVFVRILRCEGSVGEGGAGTAQFSAAYEIVSADGSLRVLAKKTFDAPPAGWDGKDVAELAKLLSEAVAQFAAQIAADI